MSAVTADIGEKESKQQILKSTGILGAAQLIIIGVGIVRVKVLALLLGPVGVGLAGLYLQISDLIKALTSFGLNYSAVRDIASSAASGEERKVAATILVMRRLVWATGIAGMLLCIIIAPSLSRWTFGNEEHSRAISLLSLSILISAIASGQSALLQGFREIAQMAKANVIASAAGLVGASIIYYYWKLEGIVPALLFTTLATLMANGYYSRQIRTVKVHLPFKDTLGRGRQMLQLGFFMSLSGLAATGTMYLVRALVAQQGGLASVGHFVAAWSISTMYISAIFGAMGADYFPRLSAVQQDAAAVRRMVNEQSEIALLLSAPIIIGMICFINLVVVLFYTHDFGPTATILRWQLAGDFFKVLGWPLGFIVLAKGKSSLFIITELAWHVLFLGQVYFGWRFFGYEITGIAFLVAYIAYLVIIYWVGVRSVQFRWSGLVQKYIACFLPLVVLAFLCSQFLTGVAAWVAGTLITGAAAYTSWWHIRRYIDLQRFLDRLKGKRTLR